MSRMDEFKERYNRFQSEEAHRKEQKDRLGNLRLVVFLAGVVISIFLILKVNKTAGFVSAAVALLLFVYLVNRYNRMMSELKRLGGMAEVNRMFLDRMQTEWVRFQDNGEEFADPDHPYTGDLDILGPKSLFQWLNGTNTHYGRKTLKELLENPDKSIDAVTMRQEAVKELSGRLDFCQRLQCEGILAKDTARDPENLLTYAEEETKRVGREQVQYLFYLLPAAVILTFVLFFLGGPVPLFVPLLLLTVQMFVFALGYKKNAEITNTIYSLKNHLGTYRNLLELMEQEQFENQYLSSLRQQLFTNNRPASGSLKSLEGIANAIDIRFSTVLYFILNFGLLWDYHCVFALEDWKRQYGREIRKWLKAVGQIEAMASLAVPCQLYPDWSFPVLLNGEPQFSAKGMGHPLIPEDRCVRNDFEIRQGACVITGSNMSGKTTLLRTVGINLVLAYSGAPVFAQDLECSVMDLYTSMRIRDDLNSGISTFYAELLRVKMIIDHARSGQPMIYLIDEIFKGTNSLDRIAGAINVLKHLGRSRAVGLISTHDFELCELEKESLIKIKNYHFSEEYVDNQIHFDYKIHKGRCRTTNARYLMKMVGIDFQEHST